MTAKVSTMEQLQAKHHFIDFLETNETRFDVREYLKSAKELIDALLIKKTMLNCLVNFMKDN